MLKKIGILFFIISMLCGFSFTSQDSIKIGFDTEPGYQPIAIAKEKSFFEREGINVDLRQFDTSKEVASAFEAGKIDVMISPINEVIALAEKGNKLKIVLITDSSKTSANVMSMRQELIDKKPNECVKIINTYFRTLAWTEDNKSETLALLGKLTNSDPETIKANLEKTHISSLKDNLVAFGNPAKKGTLYAGTEKIIKNLLDKKSITSAINTESLINPELIWTVSWSDLRAYNSKSEIMDKNIQTT